MDESYRDYCMEKAAKAIDAYVPATDAEWASHLDQVAPLIAPDVIRISDVLVWSDPSL